MSLAMVDGAVRSLPNDLTTLLEQERSHLFQICYRMTGSASDAEDLVQETFIRAIERPPEDLEASLRPWLVRVAVNLARDHLRRRKRRGYVGVWLPTPVDSSELGALDEDDQPLSPEARYGILESASFAFLVALEELTPSQRAVLLLRDAFDYSSKETGEMLGLSEENVRVTLHRARKLMEAYDQTRCPPSKERRAATREMFQRLMTLLSMQDAAGAIALFASDTLFLGDGGGVQPTARRPLRDAATIVKIYGKISTKMSPDLQMELREVNGSVAIVGSDPRASRPAAPHFVTLLDLDAAGRIRTFYAIVAPEKLERVTFPGETSRASG